MRNKLFAYTMAAVLGLVLAVVFVASTGCGGNHKPSPSPSPTPQPASVSVTQVRGMHIHAAQTTVKTTSSLVWSSMFSLPKVEAATVTTVSVAQNWEGECASNPMVDSTSSFVLFGIGQSADPTCSHEFFDGDTTGSSAAASSISGKAVFGNGTLSNLVVTTERGTVVASANGALISLFVQRGATTIPTGLTCSLPQGADELSCANTGTFAVLTGDKAVTVVTVGMGDRLSNISVAFTKTL